MRYREHRYPCDKDVVLACPGGSTRTGTIINVSQHGARIAGMQGLSPGDHVCIDPGPGCPPRDGEVRWTRGSFVGLRFASPLDARTLSIIRRSAGHSPPASRGNWNPQLRELR